MSTALATLSLPYKKVRAVNSNDASYPSLVALATPPLIADAAAAGTRQAIEMSASPWGGATDQNRVMFVPYGLGSNNDAFNMKVVGWRRLGIKDDFDIFLPVPLIDVNCILSAFTGLANTPLLNTELICDTITLNGTSANAGVGVEIVSPTGDVPAHFVVDMKGCQLFECLFDQSTNTPTMNSLYAPY